MTIDLSQAIHENWVFTFELFSRHPMFRWEKREGYSIYLSNVDFPLFNGVYDISLQGLVDQKLNEIFSELSTNNCSANWHLTPRSLPSDLEGRLKIKNVVGKSNPAMALVLNDFVESRPSPDIEISQVSTDQELALWVDLLQKSYGLQKNIRDIFYEIFLAIGYSNPNEMQYFIAKYKGKPAGCAQVSHDSSVSGVWSVGVLEEFRKNGVGYAVSSHCLQSAKNYNSSCAILTSSDMGFNLYQQLGFKKICTYQQLLYVPGE